MIFLIGLILLVITGIVLWMVFFRCKKTYFQKVPFGKTIILKSNPEQSKGEATSIEVPNLLDDETNSKYNNIDFEGVIINPPLIMGDLKDHYKINCAVSFLGEDDEVTTTVFKYNLNDSENPNMKENPDYDEDDADSPEFINTNNRKTALSVEEFPELLTDSLFASYKIEYVGPPDEEEKIKYTSNASNASNEAIYFDWPIKYYYVGKNCFLIPSKGNLK